MTQTETRPRNLEIAFIDPYDTCPLCGGSALVEDFRVEVGGNRIGCDKCTGCGLVFQNPRLAPESIRTLYAETNYFGRDASNRLAGYLDFEKHDGVRIAQCVKRMRRVKKVSGMHQGRVLDIGSASGFSGVASRKEGFEVTCVEPDEYLASFARDHYGLNSICAPFDDCDFEPGSFDMVTLWGTDSHFMHPLHSFEKLASFIRPGGVLAMTYQNFDHWIRKVFPGLKVAWNVMYNFTDASFDTMLERVGFRLESREMEWQTVSVDHLCRVLRLPSVEFLTRVHLPVPAVSFRLIVARKL